YDDDVDVGRAIRLALESVGVARGASPGIGVCRRQDDAVGVRPVVVQTFPDASRAFRNVGMRGADVMHSEILVGTIAKPFGAPRSKIGETGYVLFGRQAGCAVEMDRGHLWLPAFEGSDWSGRSEGRTLRSYALDWRQLGCAHRRDRLENQFERASALRTIRL